MKEKLLQYQSPEITVERLLEDVITASYGKLTDKNDDKELFENEWL